MSSKPKQKPSKPSKDVPPADQRSTVELPFELKATSHMFFFSPKLLIFVLLGFILLCFSDTTDLFQKYSYLFPVRHSTHKQFFYPLGKMNFYLKGPFILLFLQLCGLEFCSSPTLISEDRIECSGGSYWHVLFAICQL